MTTKSRGSFRRNLIKLSVLIIAVFTLTLGVTYFWFVHNSKRLLIDLFNERSEGKLKLQIAEVTFNFITSTVKIREAKITSTDKNDAPISYQISFKKITLRTNTIWSLLAKHSLEMNQIKVFDPIIEVYNNSKDNNDSDRQLSIGAELGKIYNSIEDGISALHTHSIYVTNAKLVLNNKGSNGNNPIVFSHIYFRLKKLDTFSDKPGEYLQNNSIDFSSSNQDITLSDGIHKLLFKKLSIQEAKNIILDNCTIIALPAYPSGTTYNINFKKLALVGVDFKALYTNDIIRADSVYCENPNSDIYLNSNVVDTNKSSKEMPDIQKMIRSISGNLDFGFVGMTNADIHLDIKGKRTLSNFHSGKVNFEINNLRINPDSSKVVSMRNFNMMVKGYNLYNTDSTSVFSFDSVRFSNDKLLLSNFSVHTVSGKNRIRNYRDFNIPFFELLGIDWSELIFRQNLKASTAILHEPVINFRKYKELEISKKSILFNSHHSLDDFMDIEKLKIINGTLNIEWGVNNSLQLSGLDLNVLGNNITNYKHVSLNKDIESLYFSEGFLTIGDIHAQLQNVDFNTNDQVLADELLIKNNNGTFDSKITNVSIDKISSDKKSGGFLVDGLRWDNGTIKINLRDQIKEKHKPSSILLQNVEGGQTQFQIIKKVTVVSTLINSVKIGSLLKNSDQPFIIRGLAIKGAGLKLSNDSMIATSEKFNLTDNAQAFWTANFEQKTRTGNLSISAPLLNLTGEFNKYFDKELHFKNITLQSPEIHYEKENITSTFSKKSNKNSHITIDQITVYEPIVKLQDSVSGRLFLLPHSKESEIKIKDFKVDSNIIAAGNINLKSGQVEMKNGNEKVLKVNKNIDLNLKDFIFASNENNPSWKVFLNKLSLKNTEDYTFKIKQNKLELKDINVGNVQINSTTLSDPLKLLTSNPNALVGSSSLKYTTKNSFLQAVNVSYDGKKKGMEIDSISYHPLLSRDSAIAKSHYQIDYIYLTSGKTVFNNFDLTKLVNDNSLLIEKANLIHPSIHVFRDKLPPFREGIRKKLFTEEIKNIDLPVLINTLNIQDGNVSYIEKNAKSRLNGDFTLTHLNGNISNIKNYQIQKSDSLLIAITGLLLDKTSFDLGLRQSYNDPLYGFVMNLKLQPTPLYILNPLLAPLSDVKFTSGYLNDFELHALGNENFAYGKMKFYYHDLHIKLLKNGGTEKTRLLKSAESNLVNFFFLKNNNTSRTGLVYFERLKDRSFFNYITKIIFSGLSTSVGAKRNNSYRKRYKQNNITNFH